MNRPRAWWSLVSAATVLGVGISGCGGKSAPKDETKVAAAESEADSAPAAQEAAPPAAPAAAAPAAPVAAAPAAPANAGKSDAEELLSMSGGGSAPANGATPPAVVPPAAPAPAAGGSAGFAGAGGKGGMPAGYPQPGGGGGGSAGFAGAGGAPSAGGPAGGAAGADGGMPAGYPRPGGGAGSAGFAGAGAAPSAGGPSTGAPGAGGMPAGYPQPGNGGGSAGFAGGQNRPGNGEPGISGGPGGGRGGMAPGGMAPGGLDAGGGNLAKSDFSTESKGAESFLSALQAKDPERLAEATAKHSEFEASNEHKPLLTDILNKTASNEDLDKLARAFAGMKVMSLGTRKSSGMLGVVVGKQDEKAITSRTLYVRKEKGGWKVQDFTSAPRVLKTPGFRTPGRTGGNRYGG